MQCFYTSYFFMLKSVGIIPPDMTAKDFERAYSDTRGRPTVAPVFATGALGFPGAEKSPNGSAISTSFAASANSIAKNSEWARFTGMSEKNFKTKELKTTSLVPHTERGTTTYKLVDSVDVAEVRRRLDAGETIHMGSSAWLGGHHVVATSTTLIDDPLTGTQELRGDKDFRQATKIFALWAE